MFNIVEQERNTGEKSSNMMNVVKVLSNMSKPWAREKAQKIRVLAALSEDLILASNICIREQVAKTAVTSTPGDLTPYSHLYEHPNL